MPKLIVQLRKVPLWTSDSRITQQCKTVSVLLVHGNRSMYNLSSCLHTSSHFPSSFFPCSGVYCLEFSVHVLLLGPESSSISFPLKLPHVFELAFPGGKSFFALHPNLFLPISCGTFIWNTEFPSPKKIVVQNVGSPAWLITVQNSKCRQMPDHSSLHHLGEDFRKNQPRTNTFCGNKFSPTVFGRALSNFNTFKRSVSFNRGYTTLLYACLFIPSPLCVLPWQVSLVSTITSCCRSQEVC